MFPLEERLSPHAKEQLAGMSDTRDAIYATMRTLAPTPDAYERVVRDIHDSAVMGLRLRQRKPIDDWQERMLSYHGFTLFGAQWIAYGVHKHKTVHP